MPLDLALKELALVPVPAEGLEFRVCRLGLGSYMFPLWVYGLWLMVEGFGPPSCIFPFRVRGWVQGISTYSLRGLRADNNSQRLGGLCSRVQYLFPFTLYRAVEFWVLGFGAGLAPVAICERLLAATMPVTILVLAFVPAAQGNVQCFGLQAWAGINAQGLGLQAWGYLPPSEIFPARPAPAFSPLLGPGFSVGFRV